MRYSMRWGVTFCVIACAALAQRGTAGEPDQKKSPWAAAQEKVKTHRFSTLVTAQDVSNRLNTAEGLDQAIAWCKATGVTKVYIETFRDGHQAERETIERVRDRFRREGFIAHGCVTTTGVGKRSTGSSYISCYTDGATQERLEAIFRYTAGLFDVIMVDDFWFIDCECSECQKARGDQTWTAYRLALMERLSRERMIGPAREVNGRVQVIIKYPEWYERFHERGYDVVAESQLFPITWIGTETRDPDNARWGRKPQYGAYWLARWAEAFSGGRLGGGWFDPLGTTAHTYVEQARQTILGGCRECMLFCYGALLGDHGPEDIAAFRREMPGLLDLAGFVLGEKPRGVGTYRLPNTPCGEDAYLFNFIGMLGIPMTADVRFPTDAPSLLLTSHAVADPGIEDRLGRAIKRGIPVLATSNLRASLPEKARALLSAPNVRLLDLSTTPTKRSWYGIQDSVRALMNLPRDEVDALRRPLLEPLGVELSAPTGVSLHLFGERKIVVENFNDNAAEVVLKVRRTDQYKPAVILPPDADARIETAEGRARITLPPRSLMALQRR